MSEPRQPRHDDGWMTSTEMRRAFDVTEKSFHRDIKPHFPADCIRRDGRKVMFNGRACIEAWAERKKNGSDPDPLLAADTDSPALERYREERSQLARLDRLEREKTLLPRGDVHDGLSRLAHILRQAGETLQRQFGAEAAAVLNEALDDAGREIAAV